MLRLGSEAMRRPIHEPQHLWREKAKVWRQLMEDMSPLVAVAVILAAAVVYQGRSRLASREEVEDEIHETETHLRELRGQLGEKSSR
jgi:hypothetical protein